MENRYIHFGIVLGLIAAISAGILGGVNDFTSKVIAENTKKIVNAARIEVLAVLACSNGLISLFKKFIPDEVRIPAFIMIIATLVTVVDMVMNAYTHDLYKVLGLFIPLIVVNCIVLGRAERFASKNGVIDSILDGIGSGIGFTLSLTFLGSVREILGNGSVFGISLVPANFTPALIFILAPGGFITIGIIMACINMKKERDAKKKKVTKK